jgi:hypothetical protein
VENFETNEIDGLNRFKDRLRHLSYMFGVSPMGVLLLIVLVVIPFVPPFNQEHLLRWLIGAA